MSSSNKGLVGAVSAGAKSVRSAIPGGNKLALWLVFFAGAITVIKKAAPDTVPDYAVYFGISLGIAALLYEMTASKDMIRAWWHGRAGSMLASGAIWFCAFAFSINNWIGAASESQVEKSNVHKMSLMATQAVTGNLSDAEAKLDRLREQRADLSRKSIGDGMANTKPWSTPQAAQAAVQTAEAHRWFRENTQGCTITKGSQTRQFCADYQSAKAEVARWAEIAKLEIAIGDAESDVKSARSAVSKANLETSEVRGDNVLLVRYGGFAEADAETLQGLFAVVVVSILLSFGSMRSEHEELAKLGPRTPFNWGRKLSGWFSATFFGAEPQQPARTLGDICPPALREPSNNILVVERTIEKTNNNEVYEMFMEAAKGLKQRELAAPRASAAAA